MYLLNQGSVKFGHIMNLQIGNFARNPNLPEVLTHHEAFGRNRPQTYHAALWAAWTPEHTNHPILPRKSRRLFYIYRNRIKDLGYKTDKLSLNFSVRFNIMTLTIYIVSISDI